MGMQVDKESSEEEMYSCVSHTPSPLKQTGKHRTTNITSMSPVEFKDFSAVNATGSNQGNKDVAEDCKMSDTESESDSDRTEEDLEVPEPAPL